MIGRERRHAVERHRGGLLVQTQVLREKLRTPSYGCTALRSVPAEDDEEHSAVCLTDSLGRSLLDSDRADR